VKEKQLISPEMVGVGEEFINKQSNNRLRRKSITNRKERPLQLKEKGEALL
jgi:hypothetical protein